MSKIVRKISKIFGSAAATGEVKQFGSLAEAAPANSTDPTVIQALSRWVGGWYDAVLGGNAPTIQDRNAVDFVNSYQISYLLQQGIAEYEVGTDYHIDSFCSFGGSIYKSIANDNTGNPVSDDTKWVATATGMLNAIEALSANKIFTQADDGKIFIVDSSAGNTQPLDPDFGWFENMLFFLPDLGDVKKGWKITIKDKNGVFRLKPVYCFGGKQDFIDGTPVIFENCPNFDELPNRWYDLEVGFGSWTFVFDGVGYYIL